MKKKSLNKKEASEKIDYLRTQSLSDQEIYDILSKEYFFKGAVAYLIISVIKNSIKIKYKRINNILSLLLVSNFVLDLTPLILSYNIVLLIPIPFIFRISSSILCNLLIAFGVYKFKARYYIYASFMSILGVWNLYMEENLYLEYDIIYWIAKILLMVSILILGFYLNKRLFPGFYPYILEKDNKGEYILPDSD